MARYRWPALLSLLLPALWSHAASALTISVSSGGGRSVAWDGSGPAAESSVLIGSPPYASGPVAALDGASGSTSSYSFTSSELLLEFTHSRTGNGSGGYAYSDDVVGGDFFFNVDAAVTAVISGAYTVTDTGGGDRVMFVAGLWDDLANVWLHQTNLESRATANESFAVGLGGGDLTNIVQGPTSHTLLPGISYNLNWLALIQDLRSDTGDTGAAASGYIRIAFVPEPSTACLLAAGLAALGLARTRRGPEVRRGRG